MNIILFLIVPISLVILLWQVSNIVSIIFGSPYVRADREVINFALKSARLKKGEIFYDLGSGNGEALIEAAKLGALATGFEISPFYYLWSRLRTLKYPNIQIKFKNINDVEFRRADVIYCYLLPKFLEKLSPKFKKELKIGTRLISVGFLIKNMGKHQRIKIDNHYIYMYKIV